jgi:hypothetical protein
MCPAAARGGTRHVRLPETVAAGTIRDSAFEANVESRKRDKGQRVNPLRVGVLRSDAVLEQRKQPVETNVPYDVDGSVTSAFPLA